MQQPGRIQSSQRTLRKTCTDDLEKKHFVEDHSTAFTSFKNLALVSNILREFNQAKEPFEKALKIRKKTFGEDLADVATRHDDLAILYNSLGESSQAKNRLSKSTNDLQKIFS